MDKAVCFQFSGVFKAFALVSYIQGHTSLFDSDSKLIAKLQNMVRCLYETNRNSNVAWNISNSCNQLPSTNYLQPSKENEGIVSLSER